MDVRLRRLARQADLSSLDVELLIIALLPDLDSRFERLYGYLNDDVTRRRASVGLALQLAGVSGLAAAARGRLEPSRPLLRQGLVLVEDTERPLLTRGLRVPDRVAAHLLGDDTPDAALAGLMVDVAGYRTELSVQLAHALDGGRAADPPEGARRRQRRGDRGGGAGRPRDRRGRLGSGPLHRRPRSADGGRRWPSGRPCCAAPAWSPARSSTSPRRTRTWCAG